MFIESSPVMCPVETCAPRNEPVDARTPSCTECLECHNEEMKNRLKKLDKANQRLVQLLGERNDWFNAVSHELRTPLNIIINYADSLNDGIFGEMSADQKGALARIVQANDALLHTVNDLLDLSKIEVDSLRFYPLEVEYDHLVTSTVDLLRPLAEKRGLTLEVVFSGNVRMVYADPERTEQVLRNLIYNALKFTPAGGSILVRCEEVYPPNTQIVTSVTDTGPGIPKEALKSLFKPFYQVDSSNTRNKGGTGLGLAICKALVTRMDGEITAENAPEGGARFAFTLPINPRA